MSHVIYEQWNWIHTHTCTHTYTHIPFHICAIEIVWLTDLRIGFITLCLYWLCAVRMKVHCFDHSALCTYHSAALHCARVCSVLPWEGYVHRVCVNTSTGGTGRGLSMQCPSLKFSFLNHGRWYNNYSQKYVYSVSSSRKGGRGRGRRRWWQGRRYPVAHSDMMVAKL